MTPHRITIDMKKSGYKQFVNIRQAENESHIIYISLTNGTEPIKLDNDMVATVYLEGISKQWESCDIKDNEIVFTAPILNVGDTKCQIQLSNNNGYSISPTFIIVVENILNVPHFELLEEEPDDWIDNADSYYTFNGIDYVPVKFSSDRNLLTNLEFKTNDHSAGSIAYKRSQAISVSQGRKIYCTTTSNMLSITLKFEYKIGDNLSGNITTKEVYCKTQMPIVTPTITKRQYLENGYTDVVMYVVADSSYIDDNYKLTNTMLEYDEKTYINCNTPYFEKGKFYAMVNDYGNVGNSYNALIQALQEARTYYNKAIKDVSMVDNCIIITYNDNTQYKSGDLKGDGIARLDKSTDGNVDTYTFVTDKGNTFSFTITNADNTKIDDLYTQLGYKTPLAVFNNEVAYIKELINDLDAKKESIEEHNKSISQLKGSLSIINTQLSVLNNNKVEKDTYTTAIESLQSLVTKLQNSKVDTNTYNDEIANLTTAISELNDKQIDTNAIKESITELDTKKLNKEEFNQYKENVANTFANTDNDIKAVCDYVNSKLEVPLADIETLKSGKLDKTDFNSYKTSNDNAVNNKVNTTDFNAYKSATDTDISKCVTDIANNSALISKNQINVTTDKSTSIVLNDSSDCNIVDLICDSDNYNLSIYGKNLFNLKNTKIWVNDYVVPASLIVDNNSINFDITPGNFCGVYIKYNVIVKDNLLLDKSCVISLNVTADKDCKFRLRDENTNTFEVKNLTSNVATQFNLPITLNNSGKAISMYGIDIGENTHIKISNIMIELGAVATEYEDYKDFQSVTQDTDLSTIKTNYPNTTVVSDCDSQLTYIADTKNYIDSKFNELATALVAHESEVN